MNVQKILDDYLHVNSDEKQSLGILEELIKSSDDIFSRKNFKGHITASAFILNESSKQVLLLDHKSLNKMLQPGGHIEPEDDSILNSVYREVEEETGLIKQDLRLRSIVPNDVEVPFDIDTHKIPANSKKNEPEHYHHDFRYLFTTSNSNVKFDPSESNSYGWIDWMDFLIDETFQYVAEKIQAVLEPNVHDYFKSLVTSNSKKYSVVAVAHIIPSSEDYLEALSENFNLVGVIPKPKSVNKDSRRRLEKKGIKILDSFSRESLKKNPEEFINLLSNAENICLVDIGGYFSPIVNTLKDSFKNKLVGIIEDTENGHKRYQNLKSENCRIVSVARSTLKSYEDQLVGHSIGHATETVLRQINVILTYKKCGIIGYGKVGKGIGEYLQQRNIKPRVSDIDPLRSIQASCDGAIICDTEKLIKECDVIFCATGAQALDIINFRDIKYGAYIASATSSDDEFDLRFINDEFNSTDIDPYIKKYFKKGKSFYLLNDGDAINFLYSAAVDKYINLVQGEIVYSICRLSKNRDKQKIMTNAKEDHEFIAEAWLSYIKRNQQTD